VTPFFTYTMCKCNWHSVAWELFAQTVLRIRTKNITARARPMLWIIGSGRVGVKLGDVSGRIWSWKTDGRRWLMAGELTAGDWFEPRGHAASAAETTSPASATCRFSRCQPRAMRCHRHRTITDEISRDGCSLTSSRRDVMPTDRINRVGKGLKGQTVITSVRKHLRLAAPHYLGSDTVTADWHELLITAAHYAAIHGMAHGMARDS